MWHATLHLTVNSLPIKWKLPRPFRVEHRKQRCQNVFIVYDHRPIHKAINFDCTDRWADGRAERWEGEERVCEQTFATATAVEVIKHDRSLTTDALKGAAHERTCAYTYKHTQTHTHRYTKFCLAVAGSDFNHFCCSKLLFCLRCAQTSQFITFIKFIAIINAYLTPDGLWPGHNYITATSWSKVHLYVVQL